MNKFEGYKIAVTTYVRTGGEDEFKRLCRKIQLFVQELQPDPEIDRVNLRVLPPSTIDQVVGLEGEAETNALFVQFRDEGGQ